jgi:hypothetical protein
MRTATTIDELAFVTLREAVRDIRKGRFTAE